MFSRSTSLAAVLALHFVTGDLHAQSSFRTLGGLPNNFPTFAAAVSHDGSVVAGRSWGQIFRWTQETGLYSLGGPPPPYNGDPTVTDMSGDGSIIIGYAHDFGHKIFPTAAFIWTQEGGTEYLGPPGGSDGSYARSICADNTVYGKWDLLPEGRGTYKWNSSQGFVRLFDAVFPSGASDDGVFILGCQNTRWSLEGGREFLGGLPDGGMVGCCTDASYDGSVIVGRSQSGNCSPSSEFEGFRWTEATGMVGIGSLQDERGREFWSHPMAVSGDGSVIVGESVVDSDAPWEAAAFIWRDDGRGMRKLRDVLIEGYGLGPQLEGWELLQANDVSPDGQYIVGTAESADGLREAYLVRLGSPCRADFNADGDLDSADFFDFLAEFFAAGPRADFNRDSRINSQDFFDFVATFFAGC